MASWTSGFDKQTRSPPPDRYRYYPEPDYSDYKGRDSGDRRRYSDFPPHRGFDDKRAFPRSPLRDAYDGMCLTRPALSFPVNHPSSTSRSLSPDRSLKRKRSVSPPNRYVRFRYDEGMNIHLRPFFNVFVTYFTRLPRSLPWATIFSRTSKPWSTGPNPRRQPGFLS